MHVQLAAPVQGRVVERAARLAEPGVDLRPGLPGAQPAGELRRIEVDGKQRPVGEVRAVEGVEYCEQRCRALAVLQPPKLVANDSRSDAATPRIRCSGAARRNHGVSSALSSFLLARCPRSRT
jgi:hypothetical protein